MSTEIQWVKNQDGSRGETWNPITGCTPISEGCTNCYAKRLAEGRLKGRCGYPADEPFRVTYHPERLEDPFSWRKSQTIFICSMGDLFHNEVSRPWQNDIFEIVERCPIHTFIILTKRPGCMSDFIKWRNRGDIIPNLWLGISCENQQRADERIPILMKIPAAVRFISVEPMLEAVDVRNWLHLPSCPQHPLNTYLWKKLPCDCRPFIKKRANKGEIGKIDWIIMGCESGPNARPMKYEWAQDIADQCRRVNIPLFYKQGIDDNGRFVKMPKLLGKIWNQMPAQTNRG